jgi:two-component system invasion response regulator UvrY
MNILIGDDHVVVRRGLISILSYAFPHAFIEEAKNGKELLSKSIQNDWHIVISDISMPDMNGIEFLKEIREIKPQLKVLMLSVNAPELYAIPCLKAGAYGYVSKDSAPDELEHAVLAILDGRKYLPEILRSTLADFNFLDINL